ncbi:MAG: fimbrillin family protein [Alistipes sp.]|nr:fimbrillin family protein [Alistipes sp.]
MKRLFAIRHLVVLAVAAATTLMVSCFKDDIIELPSGKPFQPTTSDRIVFQAGAQWAEEDVISRNAATPNRVGKHELTSADGELSLPMGVYVEDGIRSTISDAETRGTVITDEAGITNFNVWAALTKTDDSVINYFSNIAYKKESDNIFYPVNEADEYYWPGSGKLDFVAVANTPASGFTTTMTGNKLTSFDYTVPADATAQNDIMVAIADEVDGNLGASVPLEFKHIMSAVNIQIGSISAGTIESITLKGVYDKGTFNIATRKWSVDTSSTKNYTVKFAGGGDSFTTTGNQAAGTNINADDATFLFIPQEPGEGAVMDVVFNNGDKTETVSASIAGDIWDMAKTVNYRISIDESFTLLVEPTGKKLDAHYIITDVNVTVKGITNWQITAVANDNAEVTILPYDEANPLAQAGFWTDKEVDTNGVEGNSARGTNSYTGSGDITAKHFVLFIPENISDSDRQISIILSSTTDGSTATTTKVLLQKYPNWTANDIGWEVVDDDEAGKYGFKWTRKVSYIFPYKLGSNWTGAHYTEDEARALIQGFIDQYDAGDYVTYDTFTHNWFTTRMYIQIDYTKLNNISGATSSSDGLANTLALYDLAGSAATGAFEAAIKNTYKTESGKEGENMFRLAGDYEISEGVPAHEGSEADLSGILEYILKKNEYQLYKENNATIGSITYFVKFNRSDLKWYLPAYGQFTGVDFTPEDSTDKAADYWSSTAVNGNTYSYIGSGEQKDRDESFAVIAGRKNINEYGTGTATVTVDNSSIAGGENGDTNNWLE